MGRASPAASLVKVQSLLGHSSESDGKLASARGSSVPSIRRQNASGRLWAKSPMVGGGAGFVV